METGKKKLSLVVDMYGCPNRCLHCWLGHMPNKRMAGGEDEFIVRFFTPFFDEIAFYSWAREPDFCDDYEARWERDWRLSVNACPERFELASFWRIVRDAKYVPFLKSAGVKKVQLTLFGEKETQDRYVGRKGAWEEVMRATEKLIEGGILPRWQCFINEENKEEIVRLYERAKEIRRTACPGLEFFVHEGTCDGENRKLYPVRIRKNHIPRELEEVYLDFENLTSESECCELLKNDFSTPDFPVGNDLVLYISNDFGVYYNYTNMTRPWMIGNLKTDSPEEIVRKVFSGDVPALNEAKKYTWSGLASLYGDPSSDRVFSPDDFKIYLLNECADRAKKPRPRKGHPCTI